MRSNFSGNEAESILWDGEGEGETVKYDPIGNVRFSLENEHWRLAGRRKNIHELAD